MRKTFLFLCLIFMIVSETEAYMTTKKVIAHRGVSSMYPENTLLSFKNALDTKAAFIECDVHLSRDGKVVVMHDEDLSRTTNGEGLIGEHTVSELKKLSAGFSKKFGDRFNGEKIPLLIEVLELIEPSDKMLFIEIKSHKESSYNGKIGEIVYDTVIKNFPQLKDRVAFISFNVDILKNIRELDSKVIVAPIFSEMPKVGSLADQALRLESDIVIFSKRLLTKNVIEKENQVRHIVYTVLPEEFDSIENVKGLWAFATDYAHLIE